MLSEFEIEEGVVITAYKLRSTDNHYKYAESIVQYADSNRILYHLVKLLRQRRGEK